MSASCFKSIPFTLAKPALCLHCHFFHPRHFNSQTKFRKTHYDKLESNDYQILNYLSRNKLQDARKLIDKTTEQNHPHWLVVHFTSLLTKYSKNGFIDESKILFEHMPYKNIVTYNAMLSGLLHNGRLSEAMSLFEMMPERNVVSWTAMICGLADTGRICEARRLFEEMPVRNVVSWNSMVAGLVRNGELKEARQIFDSMPVKNVISWNAMISGYVESCRMGEARVLFDEMEERNVVTWTTMISGYCRAGEVKEGYLFFRNMPEKNIVSWTAMIGGFAWNGFHEEALFLFIEMRGNYDVRPNRETFISLAYACAGMWFPHPGKQLHAQVIVNSWEYDDYDGRLSKSLIHMYSLFGIMDFAHYIFNKNINNCNVQSFNSLIKGYIRIGRLEEAQNLFETVPFRDEISWTSMINAYLSVGEISKASYLFYNMPHRDAVAWTAMISGYVQNELSVEATYLFLEMRAHCVSPLNSTYSILLGAAGATANLDQGKQIHCMLIKTQSGVDLILENSLISMYAKCGVIDDAYIIFSNMLSRDLVSWNSMIMGFSHHGLANEALKVFDLMLESRTHPNSVTFLGVLSACSHVGLVSRGWELFNAMYDVYAIEPSLEHYVCMINLLGRAGKVREAEELVLGLPFKPDHRIWGALLGACGFGEKNVDIAEHAATQLLELDPFNSPAHVVLCNIYAMNGQHAEEHKLRKEMGLKGVRKNPGCSWIVLNGGVHAFLSGEKIHPQAAEMLSLLFKIDYAS
ncbi:pentatricopeptide repeat-containing protein At1g32415, mitochondrial [Pistacia vera]|uniref:pentatricopeptide repeat-containing protein At1g32415, mitochondrial n=1 Tax=Pistacia vera TaxID=55513 RepID=UPI001262BA98|nr:pentatricopeptide repeat-containing protein At1g32415, mitochondrial [Pistacia vera]